MHNPKEVRKLAFQFESEWAPYAFPQERDHISTTAEMLPKLQPVDFRAFRLDHGGIPVISDGQTGYVIDNDQMTIVYGKTGSGKTRSLVVPLICTLAKAGENMVIFDQKGDFSTGIYAPYVRGSLEKQGYKTIILDFKGLEGDGMNIMGKIMEAYDHHQEDDLEKHLDALAASLHKQEDLDDPKSKFWTSQAATYFSVMVKLLLAVARNRGAVNFRSICSFCNHYSAVRLNLLLEYLPLSNTDKTKLRNVVSMHDSGITSVMASASDFLSIYNHNNPLLRMCSQDTFEIADLYRRKTAVIICVPDATSAYDRIAAAMLTNILSELVQYAAKAPDNRLPRRVNVIADEFANYRVPDFERRISTDRSKNIRYYLFLQGQDQLYKSYPQAASTIVANCTNVFFFSSAEFELMQNLSNLSGTRKDNLEGLREPLISVSDLQSLKQKQGKRECYYTDGSTRFFTSLPDISHYEGLKGADRKYAIYPHSHIEKYELEYYNMDSLIRDLKRIYGDFDINCALASLDN